MRFPTSLRRKKATILCWPTAVAARLAYEGRATARRREPYIRSRRLIYLSHPSQYHLTGPDHTEWTSDGTEPLASGPRLIVTQTQFTSMTSITVVRLNPPFTLKRSSDGGHGYLVLSTPHPTAELRKMASSCLSSYTRLGLKIDNAVNAREAGIYSVWERMSQGSYKIFRSCQNTMAEYRLYRRNERGEIIKANDHLMDAMRYNVMSGLSRAKVEPKNRPNGEPWYHYAPPPFWSG